MPQAPQTGSLEQILRMLQGMAQSPAYKAEMDAMATAMNAQLDYQIRDVAGTTTTIHLVDAQVDWVADTFAGVQISDQLAVTPPYPRLVLVATAGHSQFDEAPVSEWKYRVDAVVLASQDDPEHSQRLALVMLDAFDRLVSRNQSLGGLVQLITSESPITAGGTGHVREQGIVGAAMIRYGVDVLRVA